jgi:hypothetical protein
MEKHFLMETIFTLCSSSPSIGLPVGDAELHKSSEAGRFPDTLIARIIAWSLILRKKYLTEHTIRYRMMLPTMLKTFFPDAHVELDEDPFSIQVTLL